MVQEGGLGSKRRLADEYDASQTARRKVIYLELHPETEHGANAGGPSGQFVRTENPSFAAETAAATGKDERTVRRDAERGEKVIPEVIDMITGTKLDTANHVAFHVAWICRAWRGAIENKWKSVAT